MTKLANLTARTAKKLTELGTIQAMSRQSRFGTWFKERFPEAAQSPTAFARERDIPHGTILNYVGGKSAPRKFKVAELAEKLGVPVEEIWRAAGYGAFPGSPVMRTPWETIRDELDQSGDDEARALTALTTLATLPEPTRTVLRLQLRTLIEMIDEAARLYRLGATVDEAQLPRPPVRAIVR